MKIVMMSLVLVVSAPSYTTAGPVAQIVSMLPKLDLKSVRAFIANVKSLFGSGSEFATKYGYHYNNVYSDQLKYQVLNTFANVEQLAVEDKQLEVMSHHMQLDKTYFIIFTVALTIIALGTTGLFILKLRSTQLKTWTSKSDKIIQDYKREVNLNSILNAP